VHNIQQTAVTPLPKKFNFSPTVSVFYLKSFVFKAFLKILRKYFEYLKMNILLYL